jgi:hypothetical protein
MSQFLSCYDRATVNRCFFDTETGYMGMGPRHTQLGDLAVVLIGGSFCFILRPKGQWYELVGDAYVHGAMNGEFIHFNNDTLLNTQELGFVESHLFAFTSTGFKAS